MVNVQPEKTASGRYILKEKVAEGGMGIVYLATDRLTGQDIALKQVKLQSMSASDTSTAAAENLDEKSALAQEFRAIASIRHPNIISVLDYGFLDDGSPYFTMDYLESFDDFVEGGYTKPTPKKIDLLIELFSTLDYLHRRGMLHRDIKPANVGIYQDSVQVLDFGLSVDVDSLQQSDTGDIQIAGTLTYMAPEVLQGDKPTPSADLYAVGVMAYEIFTGKHPFDATNISSLIMDVVNTEPDFSLLDTVVLQSPPPQQPTQSPHTNYTTVVDDTVVIDQHDSNEYESDFVPSNVSSTNPLANVVRRLLAKTPDIRYTNAIDVVRDLTFALERTSIRQSEQVRESYLQSARFVGRDTELGVLQDAIEETKIGQGSAWLIRGEAGVGKSRLIDELRTFALIKGFTTVRGQALSDNNIPYQLWRDPIRRMLLHNDVSDIDARVLKDLVDDIERLLERPIEDPEHVEGDKYRERMQASILSLFQDIESPLMLILEDIQWEDHSIDTLNRLATIIHDEPILVIATYRTEEGEQMAEQMPDFSMMELNRLSQQDISKLSESIIGKPPNHDEIVNLLYRETDGNVYFIIDILRELSVKSGGLHAIATSQLQTDISGAGVMKILQSRLSKMTMDSLYLLKILALAGRAIDLDIAKQIDVGLSLDSWLVSCSNLSILDTSDNGEWRFVHDAMRRTILSMIEDSEVVSLHTALATAIEMLHSDHEEYASILANHWRHAQQQDKEEHYAHIAANYALHIGNLQDAKDLYTRLLDIMPQSDDDPNIITARADIEIHLCETLYYLGEDETALTLIEGTVNTLRQVDNPSQLADALIEHAEVLKRQGNLVQAEVLVGEALGLAASVDYKKTMIYAMDRLSDLSYHQGNYEQASHYANDGLALSLETEDIMAQGSLLNNLGMIAFAQGDGDNAKENFSKAKDIYNESGQVRSVAVLEMNLGSVTGQAGDLDTCLAYFESALDTFKSIGEKRMLSRIYSNLGFVARLKEDLLASVDYYEEGLKIARSIGIPVEVSLVLCNLADVNRVLGDINEAKKDLLEAVKLSHQSSAAQVTLLALSHMLMLIDSPDDIAMIIGHIRENSASNQEARERCEVVLGTLQEENPDIQLDDKLAKGQAMTIDEIVTQVLKLF